MESVNLPKACGLRSQAWSRFCLTLRKILKCVNVPKACDLRARHGRGFVLRKIMESVNLPKTCGLRSQT